MRNILFIVESEKEKKSYIHSNGKSQRDLHMKRNQIPWLFFCNSLYCFLFVCLFSCLFVFFSVRFHKHRLNKRFCTIFSQIEIFVLSFVFYAISIRPSGFLCSQNTIISPSLNMWSHYQVFVKIFKDSLTIYAM